MEQYNPYFSGSVPSDQEAADRLARMYEAGTQAKMKELQDRYKLGKAQIDGSYREALLRSGDTRAGIEEAREYHRGQLEQARQEMLQLGIPKLQIDQFLAAANTEIARGELQYKQYAAQGDVAYKQGVLQQARDEMLQMGIPKVMVDRFVAESNAAYQRGELGLKREEMERIGIPKMLTDRYSAEAQSAYQQGQLGLTAQQQQQQAIEQQRRYALDVAKYGTELASQPDRYFQAQQFAAMAPRLLGLQGTAGPGGGPTPGINQMGSLLAQATEGLQNQATPYQMPTFPTMPGYSDPGGSPFPQFPTMPAYTAPPLGPMPQFPTAQFGPMAPLTTPWGTTVPGYPGSQPPGAPADPAAPGVTMGGIPDLGGPPPGEYYTTNSGGMQGGGGQSTLAQQSDAQYQALYGGGGGGYGGPLTGGAGDQSYLAGQSGQQYGQPSYPTGTGTYGGPTAGATPTYTGGAAAQNLSALPPDEQGRYHQLTARRAQLQRSGSMAGWSPEDEAELGRYLARMRAPSGYGTADPRQKQLAQIAKASPPSPFDGLNETDQATLKLIESVYKRGGQGIQGGELERMGKAQTGFMSSAGKLLGYDPEDLYQTYRQYRPSQGSASLAG